MADSKDWFDIRKIDENTFVISEPHHWEETNFYLLVGSEKAMLIDTGLGVCNISEKVKKLTDKPVFAVPTHVHWDHIGGLSYFPEFYVHEKEEDWINGNFPLPVEFVRNQLVKENTLPSVFNVDSYNIFRGKPESLLDGNSFFNLGGRIIKVIETPGHSPGHMCFFEENTGYLFSGDLIYKGTLFANYPSTDPEDFLQSVEKIAELPIKRILPAHHSLDLRTDIVSEIRDELKKIKEKGLLRHGSGLFDYGEWQMLL